MKYDLNKYKFITYRNVVKAVSTYAGKTVVGTAKCHPSDEYSMAHGMELAGARCNARVAEKREKRAAAKLIEAQQAVEQATAHMRKMEQYYADAIVAKREAEDEVIEIVKGI